MPRTTDITARARPGPATAAGVSEEERQGVLEMLHSKRFADVAPPEVYAALLDEGVYLASVSTMYRAVRSVGEVRERAAGRPPAVHQARAGDRPSQPGLELGHHQAAGAREVDLRAQHRPIGNCRLTVQRRALQWSGIGT